MTMYGIALFGCILLGMIGAVAGRHHAGGIESGWTMLTGVGVGLVVYFIIAAFAHVSLRKCGLVKWKETTLSILSCVLVWGSPAVAFVASRMIIRVM